MIFCLLYYINIIAFRIFFFQLFSRETEGFVTIDDDNDDQVVETAVVQKNGVIIKKNANSSIMFASSDQNKLDKTLHDNIKQKFKKTIEKEVIDFKVKT